MYNLFLLTTIVGLLHDGQVEIIEVKFSLEGEFVVSVEEVKGERGFWLVRSCRIPAHLQKLAVRWYPGRSLFTGTKLNVQIVGTIKVNDKDLLGGLCSWAGGVLVVNVEAVT